MLRCASLSRVSLTLCLALWAAGSAQAHGLATCDSGPQDKWQPKKKLERQLTD